MIEGRDMLRQFLPKSIISCLRIVRARLNRLKYHGKDYYCNVCNSNLRAWVHAGPVRHLNFVCPVCNSYGRHRMMALIFQKEFLDVDAIYGKKLLHFAPEVGFGNWLRRQFPQLNYQSADLFSPDVDLCLDLQEIALPNNCVDFIVLSHVLEHVVNDIKALSELNRILCLGGKLFVQVPLSEKPETIEDRLDSADSRLLHYGKTDHVRLYGADLKNRLSDAGFEVIIESASNEAYRELMPRMALDLPDNSTMLYDNESTTFICQKISF